MRNSLLQTAITCHHISIMVYNLTAFSIISRCQRSLCQSKTYCIGNPLP